MKQMIKYLGTPLGQGDSFAPARKQWIAAAIGAGVGLASSLIGGASAARAQRRAMAEQRAAEAKENAWYTRRYNEDYADTAAGQNLVRMAKEHAKNQWKKAAGAQAVAGGTDAATQMAKDAGNKMVGDTLANIAAADSQRKAQIDNIHMQNEQRFAQQRAANEMQRAQNITDAAQNASNAIISAGAAIDQVSTPKTSLTGGSNNSKVVEQTTATPATMASNAVTKAIPAGHVATLEEQQHFRDTIFR